MSKQLLENVKRKLEQVSEMTKGLSSTPKAALMVDNITEEFRKVIIDEENRLTKELLEGISPEIMSVNYVLGLTGTPKNFAVEYPKQPMFNEYHLDSRYIIGRFIRYLYTVTKDLPVENNTALSMLTISGFSNPVNATLSIDNNLIVITFNDNNDGFIHRITFDRNNYNQYTTINYILLSRVTGELVNVKLSKELIAWVTHTLIPVVSEGFLISKEEYYPVPIGYLEELLPSMFGNEISSSKPKLDFILFCKGLPEERVPATRVRVSYFTQSKTVRVTVIEKEPTADKDWMRSFNGKTELSWEDLPVSLQKEILQEASNYNTNKNNPT